MGFEIWNEGKYFKIELLLVNMDISPSSLVPSQISSTPYVGNTRDVLENLQIISVLEGFTADHHELPQFCSYTLSQNRTIKTPMI